MASNKVKLVWFLIMVVNLSLSSSIFYIHVSAYSASASSTHHEYVSFSLTHRDAESSPMRSVEADPGDLPEDMPMRAFVAAGRALRGRLLRRKAAGKRLVSKLSYGGDIVGDFFLTVSVGSPSQKMNFLVDTGSEFCWTQCSPCLNCTSTTAPRFAYHQSSSFLTVAFDSRLCASSVGLTVKRDNPLCRFGVAYLDGSVERGFLSIDSFDLGPAFSQPFVFGCANLVHETVPFPFSGLFGLDAGPFSFTSQLFASNPGMPKKFAYCLPDRIKSLNVPGRIEFGSYKQPAKVRYTPLAPPYGPLNSLYYYVKLEGIAVGESLIRVDMEAEGGKGGGTVFDSGSALTLLVKPVYDEMVREMKRQTAHLGPFSSNATGSNGICYKAPLNAEKPPNVPRISMHFAGGLELELLPASILMPAAIIENKSIAFCLAFSALNTADNNINIIGNYQQQNYWVEYDLEASSLGLAKAKCANYK